MAQLTRSPSLVLDGSKEAPPLLPLHSSLSLPLLAFAAAPAAAAAGGGGSGGGGYH